MPQSKILWYTPLLLLLLSVADRATLWLFAQIDPYQYLPTLEFDGTDWWDSGEKTFPVRIDFNTTQDANQDGVVNAEDNLENIVPFAIGNNISGTGKTGLSGRGPNDQRPATYFHVVHQPPFTIYQYWFYYADNDWINNHEHDWEWYFLYLIDGYPTHIGLSWHGATQIDRYCAFPRTGTHPRIGVDGGAHAMKNADEDGVRLRWDGWVFRRNSNLQGPDSFQTQWLIFSNDPDVQGALPFPMTPDTFYYGDPEYGTGEWSDPRLAPWLRTLWVQPPLPAPVEVPRLPTDTAICPGDTLLLFPGNFQDYVWNTGDTSATLLVTDTGIYRVQVTDPDGCTYEDSIHVRWIPAVVADIVSWTAGDSLILTVGSGTLTSHPLSWEWHVNDTIFPNVDTLILTTPDTYTVCLQVTGQCNVDSACMQVVVLPPDSPILGIKAPATQWIDTPLHFAGWVLPDGRLIPAPHPRFPAFPEDAMRTDRSGILCVQCPTPTRVLFPLFFRY